MGVRTCNKIGNPPIDMYLGTAYDDVALVARNMDAILAATNGIDYLTNYLGASDTPPTTRLDGSPLEDGDYYYNSTTNALTYYDLDEGLWYEVDPADLYNARDAAIAAATEAQNASNSAVNAQNEATLQADRAETEADRAEAAANSGIEEAPEDGKEYTRKDASWNELIIPDSGISEAPIDGKQYARKDANWEEVEGGGMSDFKMEDATDASLNSTVLDPNGYDLIFGTGWQATEAGVFAFNSFSPVEYITKSNLDVNGKTIPWIALNNSSVDIEIDGVLAHENVIFEVEFDEDLYIFNWTSISASTPNTLRIIPRDAGFLPLEEGDTWVYNESEGKFKPTQILAQGRLEDATDVELNSTATSILYRWGGVGGGVTDQGGTGVINYIIDGVSTRVVSVNGIDLDGNVMDAEALNGTTVGISIDGGDIEFATIIVELLVPSFPTYYLLWDNAEDYTDKLMILTIYGTGDIPLQEGDALVYNSTKQKFKPTPAVPTVVVTEFPASPKANTLYIKVV